MDRISKARNSRHVHRLQAWIGQNSIFFGYLTLEGALVPYPINGGRSREVFMKELKIAVCVILVLALSPLVGFWIVALVGAGLLLLPIGAAVATAFPETWKHIEDNLFSRNSFLSAS